MSSSKPFSFCDDILFGKGYNLQICFNIFASMPVPSYFFDAGAGNDSTGMVV